MCLEKFPLAPVHPQDTISSLVHSRPSHWSSSSLQSPVLTPAPGSRTCQPRVTPMAVAALSHCSLQGGGGAQGQYLSTEGCAKPKFCASGSPPLTISHLHRREVHGCHPAQLSVTYLRTAPAVDSVHTPPNAENLWVPKLPTVVADPRERWHLRRGSVPPCPAGQA